MDLHDTGRYSNSSIQKIAIPVAGLWLAYLVCAGCRQPLVQCSIPRLFVCFSIEHTSH